MYHFRGALARWAHPLAIRSPSGIGPRPCSIACGDARIEGYCLALRTEVKPHNVEVVLVNPGDFSTNFTRNRRIVDTPEAKEAYPNYIKTMGVVEKEENRGLSPEVLAKKIERILQRKKCPPRCVVASPVQRASVFVKRILPESLFYRIIQKYYMP